MHKTFHLVGRDKFHFSLTCLRTTINTVLFSTNIIPFKKQCFASSSLKSAALVTTVIALKTLRMYKQKPWSIRMYKQKPWNSVIDESCRDLQGILAVVASSITSSFSHCEPTGIVEIYITMSKFLIVELVAIRPTCSKSLNELR